MKEFTIDIQDGDAEFIHDDELTEAMSELGDVTITRASHVEPASGYCMTCKGPWYDVECAEVGHERGLPDHWAADMAPSNGPVLGPFTSRALALAAEREWLRTERGL